MVLERFRQAARRNIENAQAKWKSMTSREQAQPQPQRRKPGATGEGNYYHVEVRPQEEFTTFRTQDVGSKGHIERVAGRRPGGSWATAKWLISKEDAHVEGDRLIGDTQDAKDLLKKLGSQPVHTAGDRFEAKGRSTSGSPRKRAGSRPARKTQSTRRKKP